MNKNGFQGLRDSKGRFINGWVYAWISATKLLKGSIKAPEDHDSLFVISSTTFKTLEQAKQQLTKWHLEGKLDKNAKVYTVCETWTPKIINSVELEMA